MPRAIATVRAYLDIWKAQYLTEFAVNIQYRASTAIWLIGAILEPVIYLIVWTTVANAQGGSVNGLTAGDFAAYYIVGMVVQQSIFSWIMWEYEVMIRDGTYAARLMRPIHPIFQDIAVNVSYKTITFVVMIPVAFVLSLLFRPTFHLQLWSLAAFVPAVLLAFALRFMLDWTLAQAAFWTTRVSAVNRLYEVVFILLSGRFAPLSLFPPAILLLANLLPFRWMLSFPIEIFLGQLTPQEAVTGFAAQLGWIALAYLLMRFVWKRSVTKFSAVGT